MQTQEELAAIANEIGAGDQADASKMELVRMGVEEDEAATGNINVQLPGSTEITRMSVAVLDKSVTIEESADFIARRIEYRLRGTDIIVHASAHAHLKRGVLASGQVAEF